MSYFIVNRICLCDVSFVFSPQKIGIYSFYMIFSGIISLHVYNRLAQFDARQSILATEYFATKLARSVQRCQLPTTVLNGMWSVECWRTLLFESQFDFLWMSEPTKSYLTVLVIQSLWATTTAVLNIKSIHFIFILILRVHQNKIKCVHCI